VTETPAVVIRAEGEFALVESEPGTSCGRCDSVKGCSSASLGKLFCSTPRRFRVINGLGARPGERVMLGVEDGAVMRSATAVYGLPLLLLLAGAAIGAALGDAPGTRDLYALAGAAAGLLAGLAAGRGINLWTGADPRFLPRILRRA
jgi:sigma-E factor negative regulatory protein RseC